LQVSFLLALPETNPNISYSNGNTPLIIAVQENHTDIVLMLLSRPDIKVP
jgi:ankyrin repeat protein